MAPELIEENDPVLSAGSEWHSEAIRLHPGQKAKVTVIGKRPVYAGIFRAVDYAALRNRLGTSSRFKFGSDQSTFVTEVAPDSSDDYYLVVRNGVFTPKQRVHVRLIVEGDER